MDYVFDGHDCTTVLYYCLHSWALVFATGFTAIACGASFVLIYRHLRSNNYSLLRILTIRILLMVPIYAVEAFIALVVRAEGYLSEILLLVRELYEAIVIFTFLQFVLVCIGGHKAALHQTPDKVPSPCVSCEDAAVGAMGRTETNNQDVVVPPGITQAESNCRKTNIGVDAHRLHHLWPIHYCCRPWGSVRSMTKWCIRGAMSYVVVGAISALASFILWMTRGGHKIETHKPWFFAQSVAISIVQTIAIMALAELAHNLVDKLDGLQPIGKFLAVKMVVFFTFWQGLLIGGLLKWSDIFDTFVDQSSGWMSPEQIANGVTNFLLCAEMSLFAIAHLYVFLPEDYRIVLASRGIYVSSEHPDQKVSWKVIAVRLKEALSFRDMVSTARDVGVPKVHHRTHVRSPQLDAHDNEGTEDVRHGHAGVGSEIP